MSTEVRTDDATGGSSVRKVDLRLEAVVIPVSDVDRAKRFYDSLGWTRAGVIPDYALMPDGAPCAATFFYKALGR